MKNELIIWFQENYKILFKEMENTNHNHHFDLHPYHQEGSVWCHTMMVMSYIDLKITSNMKTVLMITALLHDIGKTRAIQYKEPNRYVFNGHEGLSTFMAIEILWNIHDKLKIINQKHYKNILKNLEKLINMELLEMNPNLYMINTLRGNSLLMIEE